MTPFDFSNQIWTHKMWCIQNKTVIGCVRTSVALVILFETHENRFFTSICTELQMQTNQVQIEIYATPTASSTRTRQLNNLFRLGQSVLWQNEMKGKPYQSVVLCCTVLNKGKRIGQSTVHDRQYQWCTVCGRLIHTDVYFVWIMCVGVEMIVVVCLKW